MSSIDSVRQAVLAWVFELLYGRLGFLHEVAGEAAFGAAWHARRRLVLPDCATGRILDIGCGEGRLLALHAGTFEGYGIEPSTVMTKRARRHGVSVVCARAQALPIASASIAHVICTYPGPWIVDPETWSEIERITLPAASVNILLGGTVTRGTIRPVLTRLAYGQRRELAPDALPQLGSANITGEYRRSTDRWGEAVLWCGLKTSSNHQNSDDAGPDGPAK